jgi:hypothetical protein
MLHDEIDRRSPFAAAETFVDPLGRRNIERRGLLVVERTKSEHVGPPSFQGNKLTYNLCDFSGVEYSLYGSLVDHESKCSENGGIGNVKIGKCGNWKMKERQGNNEREIGRGRGGGEREMG